MVVICPHFRKCCSVVKRMKDVITVCCSDNIEAFEGDPVSFENPYVAIRLQKPGETDEQFKARVQRIIDKLYQYMYFVDEEWYEVVEKDGHKYNSYCISFQDREY